MDYKIPTVTLEDGRQAIAETTRVDEPEVAQFINRFSNYWTFDPRLMAWVSPKTDL